MILSCKHASPEYFRLKYVNEMFKLKALNIFHFHYECLKLTKCSAAENLFQLGYIHSQ